MIVHAKAKMKVFHLVCHPVPGSFYAFNVAFGLLSRFIVGYKTERETHYYFSQTNSQRAELLLFQVQKV